MALKDSKKCVYTVYIIQQRKRERKTPICRVEETVLEYLRQISLRWEGSVCGSFVQYTNFCSVTRGRLACTVRAMLCRVLGGLVWQ